MKFVSLLSVIQLTADVCSCSHDSSQSLITTSRIYRNASACYADLDLFSQTESTPSQSKFKWTNQGNIQISKYLDSGRSSNVFEGYIDSMPVVLKVLKPTFMSKIRRELKMLKIVQGIPGFIQFYGATKNAGCRTVSLIFESIGSDAQWLSHRAAPLTSYEIQLYCYKLLKALDICHSKGVMHRDIKPRNVLYNRRSGELRIIDLGLSDLYTPKKQYNPSVASRHYKCPELLFEFLYYDYSIDIWSAGCMFAGLIFDIDPFFNGTDTFDQIQRISSLLGSDSIYKWIEKFKIPITKEMRKAIGSYKGKHFSEFRNKGNCNLCSADAVELVGKMLTIDHQDRPTAAECLQHPYFDNVRRLVP
jgi:casein kinase II subunit alpha